MRHIQSKGFRREIRTHHSYHIYIWHYGLPPPFHDYFSLFLFIQQTSVFVAECSSDTHGTKMIVLLLNGLVKPKMNNEKFTIIFENVLCMCGAFYTRLYHKWVGFLVPTREYGPRICVKTNIWSCRRKCSILGEIKFVPLKIKVSRWFGNIVCFQWSDEQFYLDFLLKLKQVELAEILFQWVLDTHGDTPTAHTDSPSRTCWCVCKYIVFATIK